MLFDYDFKASRKFPHCLTIIHKSTNKDFSWDEVNDRNHFVNYCKRNFDVTYSLVLGKVYFRTRYDALKAKMLYEPRTRTKSFSFANFRSLHPHSKIKFVGQSPEPYIWVKYPKT